MKIVFTAFILCFSVSQAFAFPNLSGLGDMLANAPGFSGGPLAGAGIPQFRESSNRESDFPVNIPDAGGAPVDSNLCSGESVAGGCLVDGEIQSQPGLPANISVVSPLGALNETMNSKRIADLLSADPNTGGTALSHFSSAIQSWNNVSASTASALVGALTLSGAFTQQRYQAEQNAELAFASAGSSGRILSQSYRTCIGNLVQEGYTYAASQEVCLKRQDKGPTNPNTFEEVPANKQFNLSTHIAHPLYKGRRSVKKQNGWEVIEVSNNNLNSVQRVFGPASYSGDPRPEPTSPGERAKIIRLRHMMFIPTLANIDLGGGDSHKLVPSLIALAGDWKRLFGDIEYSYQEGGVANTSFMGLSITMLPPTFTYKAAAQMMSSQGLDPNIFDGKPAAPGYPQFVTFREHLVYTRIWKVMAKYCRSQIVPEGSSAVEGFWDPKQGDSGENAERMSWNDYNLLSTSFAPFTKDLGVNLYSYIKQTIGSEELLCDIIDPTKSGTTTNNNNLSMGASSVKNFIKQKDEPNSSMVQLRNATYALARIIAGEQLNSTVQAGYMMLGTIAGGDFESRAKEAGAKMIADRTGVYDPGQRRQQYMAAYSQFEKLLKSRVIPDNQGQDK